MSHLMIGVTGFAFIELYTLRVTFDDGAERTINFAPVGSVPRFP